MKDTNLIMESQHSWQHLQIPPQGRSKLQHMNLDCCISIHIVPWFCSSAPKTMKPITFCYLNYSLWSLVMSASVNKWNTERQERLTISNETNGKGLRGPGCYGEVCSSAYRTEMYSITATKVHSQGTDICYVSNMVSRTFTWWRLGRRKIKTSMNSLLWRS